MNTTGDGAAAPQPMLNALISYIGQESLHGLRTFFGTVVRINTNGRERQVSGPVTHLTSHPFDHSRLRLRAPGSFMSIRVYSWFRLAATSPPVKLPA
jgi:hypothetical protein